MKQLLGVVMLSLTPWVFAAAADDAAPFRLTDVTESSGIKFGHLKGGSGRHYYPEQFGGGAAFLDFDRDGWMDVLLVQGGSLPGFIPSSPSRTTLYRNTGSGTFTDVTVESGLAKDVYGFGVAAADYDNDGFTDLFITTLQGNVLWRNDGRGHFVDRTAVAGVSAPALSTGAAFVDVDNDGWLDLFVSRYTDFTFATDLRCIDAASVRVPILAAQPRTAPLPPDKTLKLAYCGPPSVPGTTNRLYRNRGNGTFVDVTRQSGIAQSVGHGLGIAVGDFNEDSSPDLFVASDMTPNRLFINNGKGAFRDLALTGGVALSSNGKAFAGMGVDTADYDGDGHLDLFVTNYENEPSSLFKGAGDGTFEDRSVASGIAGLSLRFLKWGTRFVDLDVDGVLDLFVLNGHVDDNLGDGSPPRLPPWPQPNRTGGGGAGPRLMLPGREGYRQKAQVYRGTPEGRFEDVSAAAGAYFGEKHAGRGAAFGDYDNDGDWDVLVVNNDERAVLLRNDNPRRQNWARLELHGDRCNKDAIGALVSVKTPGGLRAQSVPSAGSYLSESDRRLLFHVPAGAAIHTAEIRWPCGSTQTVEFKAGAVTRIQEDHCLLRSPATSSGRH